jgi:hypothetical protein
VPRRSIDLRGVREARRRLRELAKAHPELTGPSSAANRAAWEAQLSEAEVANTTQYTFRLPDDLIARLDAYAKRLADEMRITVTRADVVKQILLRGLDAMEAQAGGKRKR